ncbi:ImmA/IrrE family metallo-endopeptidase [Pseudoalteromonas rhizosphaerae]|uniref:ImmA/IrrE family metallo-endopeptidase n=1 Tax=Pseudoalteromonas rhizosphaerae TaxID=2518973 RepID=A0ABW8KTW0_9GAMM
MSAQALINPEILSWAMRRASLSVDMLARKVCVKPEKVTAWEIGKTKPTFKQAQKIAKATYIPFGYFFLPRPPEEQLPIPDLRTIDSIQVHEPTPELRDIVKQVKSKQEWYKDYLLNSGSEPLTFVGKFNIESKVADVVADIRKTIGVEVPNKGTWSEYFTKIINGAESAGILVQRSGIVGNNTSRKLQVAEFRGFAISDEFAPTIFINSSDAPAARLFTLLHELAHIWVGESGVSSINEHDKKEEAFCNQVAGEFLVPKKRLFKMWDKKESLMNNLTAISANLHVSKVVVARRALDCNIIDKETYKEYYASVIKAFKDSDGGGGSFYRNVAAKNSTRFSHAVVAEAFSGRLLLRDAGRLLGISPSQIKTYKENTF